MQMSNTVNFKLDDDLYFELLALRVRLRAKDGWKGFIKRVISDYKNGTVSETQRTKKLAKEPERIMEPEDLLPANSGEVMPIGKPRSQNDLFNFRDDSEVAREKARVLEKCATCGHERGEHNLSGPGCYGDGDTCQCKGFEPLKT